MSAAGQYGQARARAAAPADARWAAAAPVRALGMYTPAPPQGGTQVVGVTVPPDVGPGGTFQISWSGQSVTLTVPPSCLPGQSFLASYRFVDGQTIQFQCTRTAQVTVPPDSGHVSTPHITRTAQVQPAARPPQEATKSHDPQALRAEIKVDQAASLLEKPMQKDMQQLPKDFEEACIRIKSLEKELEENQETPCRIIFEQILGLFRGHVRGRSLTTDNLSLEQQIIVTRDGLHRSGGTILFSRIIKPVLAHGSHLIFAPDEVVWAMAKKVCSGIPNACTAIKDWLIGAWDISQLPTVAKGFMKKNGPIVVSFILGVCIFHKYAQYLKCAMQNTFLGWAHWNKEMGAWARFFSISALMIVRLVVSNVLPFTSPAFAYLIAKSQPEGEEIAGVFYLLACSMPAGAVIPLLDKFGRYFSHNPFLATKYASLATDYLPFSFWVRPLFMEPAFLAAKKADVDDEGAASAAVLAGHFMIWAGPATTMHQRKFVPDILTCILIQPLGLMEDVAVILATWAGETPTSQKHAQIALYVFMLLMNCVYYITSKSNYAGSFGRHLLVGALTLTFLTVKLVEPVSHPQTTTTLTTTARPLCATEHTNVSAVIGTVITVSVEAVIFSLLARFLEFLAKKTTSRPRSASARPQADDKASPLLYAPA